MASQGKMRAAPRDMTTGPIGRTLLLFALPTLASNVLQSLNGSINAVWIGRLLGENALAATSNANLAMFLMFALGFGFAMASTILVGQSMGRRDIVAARRAFGTAMGLFAIVSVAIAAIGWTFAPELLHALATPPAALPFALAYLRVIFLAMPPMFLGLMISMALRGSGDSMTPFFFMILNVALDAGLNPFFIRGFGPIPAMGIAGSAMTTLIANYVVLVAVTAYVYARDLPIRLRGAELKFLVPDPALLKVIVVKGVPMGLQMLVMSLSALVMIGLVNRQGVEVTAAYGVAQQLWTYVQMPAMAIGAGVSAMAAQNIGAGRWDRVERITRSGVVTNLVMTCAVLAAIFVSDHATMALFVGSGSPAIPIAIHIQQIASWSFVAFGVTLVLFATARANGAVVMPLVILAVGILVFRLGFAFALIGRYGPEMLWWSFPVSSILTMLLSVVYYLHGGWKKQGLVAQAVAAEAKADAVAVEAAEQCEADAEPGGRLNPAG